LTCLHGKRYILHIIPQTILLQTKEFISSEGNMEMGL
jgi:hypothetical protein